MSTGVGQLVNNGQSLVNVVKEWPPMGARKPTCLPTCTLPAPCHHAHFFTFCSLTCHLSWFYMGAVSDQKVIFLSLHSSPSVFTIHQGGFSENFHHKLKTNRRMIHFETCFYLGYLIEIFTSFSFNLFMEYHSL